VAQLSTMDPDKVTRGVDRLVEMGYVIRNTDAADRRRVILCLTSKGRNVYVEIEELSQEMDAKWRAALTEQERMALDAIMAKLDAAAHELFDPRNGPRSAAGAPAGRRSPPPARKAARKVARAR